MRNKLLTIVFILLLVPALTFALFACGQQDPAPAPETQQCTSHIDSDKDCKCDTCNKNLKHKDEDGDGECDKCGKELEGGASESKDGILLIKDCEPNFAFVTENRLSSALRMELDSLAEELSEDCGKPEILTLGSENGAEVYIYVGIELGKIFDGYTLGYEGYMVTAVDGNIIVSAGSDVAMDHAFKFLKKEVFGKWDGKSDFYFSDKMEKTVETKYRTEISVGDADISDYVIFWDGDLMTNRIALSVRDSIYKKCGARLGLTDAESSSPSIIVRNAEKVSKGGFRVYESDGDIIIECAFKNEFEKSVEKFLADVIKTGEINLQKLDFSLTVDTVYYEQFGAVGDGKTDDFAAIKAAHDYANECGQTVKGKYGATYYIKNMSAEYITVKTNVDFAGAHFIIDDTEVSRKFKDGVAEADIFVIASDYEAFALGKNNHEPLKVLNQKPIALERGATKLDLQLGYPALLLLTNNTARQYIRYGGNANTGTNQQEIVIVDAEGNIDESTPLLFDFEKLTSVNVYRIDDEPITVKNGTFTTLATKVYDDSGAYISRGLRVKRHNTTVSEIKHYVEGEIPQGEVVDKRPFYANGYNGFYYTVCAHNVEFRDCIATSHESYNSSYDIALIKSNNVRLVNVTQTEESFYDDDDWWIMGSNFCKNLLYDNCYLTRFDAHCGVYNATIRNSTVASLRLIGGGDFLIEDSTVLAKSYGGNTFIMLREDYGSTWRGNITIKNCTFDSIYDDMTRETVSIIYGEWVNHDFGYDTYLPNVYVDGISFAPKLATKKLTVFNIVNKDLDYIGVNNFALESFDGEENKNVYNPPEVVSIKNVQTGVEIVYNNGDFYKNVEIK